MSYIPRLNYVSNEEIAKLHQYGVDILKKLGMRVEDPAVRDMLCEHGCTQKDDRVYFSDSLIEEMLKAQKGKVTMTSPVTGMKKAMEIGKTFVHSTGGAPWIADMKTGKRRNGLLSDLVDTVRVMNQLPELDLPCALIYPSEVPSEITQLQQTATMLQYSHKPIYGPGISIASNAKYIAELFKIYGGEDQTHNPMGMVGISPESPLFLPKEITDTMGYIIRAGIPTSILSAPMGGLTSPLSVAGTVAQSHAEILAFACVAYLMTVLRFQNILCQHEEQPEYPGPSGDRYFQRIGCAAGKLLRIPVRRIRSVLHQLCNGRTGRLRKDDQCASARTGRRHTDHRFRKHRQRYVLLLKPACSG